MQRALPHSPAIPKTTARQVDDLPNITMDVILKKFVAATDFSGPWASELANSALTKESPLI